ncbi:MAG: hypothetical protein ABIO46_04915, partial [Chitinophagales bacterium]
MKDNGYLKQNEIEFLSLYRFFKDKIEEGTIKNDDNAVQFIGLLESMAGSLNDIILLRKQTLSLDEVGHRNEGPSEGNCPVCLEKVPVLIAGEVTGKAGYEVYLLKCDVCDTEFEDALPMKENDMISWYEKLFDQLSNKETFDHSIDGGVTSVELELIRETYEDLKKSRESILE